MPNIGKALPDRSAVVMLCQRNEGLTMQVTARAPQAAIPASDLEFLRSIDTPTACNLIEMVAPERRGSFYTVKHLHCPFPDLPPMVGFAKTVTIRARDKVPLGEAGYMQKRLDYLDYVAAEPQPSIVVIEDLDGEHAGYGAFWGEVQSNVHKALGCLGTVTNGSVRDIPMIPAGFQMLAGSISPSHAYVHVVNFGIGVNVHGMAVRSGELIHADRHGAVVVPTDKIAAMRPALEKITAREKTIIDAARSQNVSVEAIKAVMRG
jgi:regulator of RNase E activity RraA